ncbi:uncharacterized protein I303_101478 [Kwoniella dejecticola CBS 10117]|uniref:Velvet domain-containing protein n=1 Tax=Kwoniella dejecticola CBS 10117 TaxID=1296121 RepID=A0AAJ8KJM0_9TREE
MCSIVPFYFPPPPPGFQLIYVPPSDNPNISQRRSSRHLSSSTTETETTATPLSGPSTPSPSNALPPLPQLPTPSDTPMSSRSDRLKHLATDHDCVLRKYEMKMRQQPVQARMCGVGEKSDRRPIDPTPIIQLKVIDENGEDITPTDPRSRTPLRRPSPGSAGMTFMQNPYYFLFACLVGGDENEDELHVIDDGKTRFLTGTPVSSLYHLRDLDNSEAAFFVFPDLGVRKEGRYKLKLTLFEIVDQEVYYCTTMFTATFSVYSAKKFPGMSKATDLSKSFAEQGLKIRVRKDPRQPARNNKTKRKSDAADSEEEYDTPHHDQRKQHPPPQPQHHHHQAKRSRGASVGYPNEDPTGGRFYRPSSSHSHGEPPMGNYHAYQQAQSNGHAPGGFYPGHPPPGHHMPPPPPPSAYDPYRNHQALSPDYPPPHGSYPPQSQMHYYGSNSGRPSTHPAPGPAGPSHSRHHQSLPPPGYGPPEHPNFHHHQRQYPPPGYHPQAPPSAYRQHQRHPSYPDSAYGDHERERDGPRNSRTSGPWPQDREREREMHREREREREREYVQARSRDEGRERDRDRERYLASTRGPPQLDIQAHSQRPRTRDRDGPRPLSPRSRISPTRPTYSSHSHSLPHSVQPSPTMSPGPMYDRRPVSSSSRERERERERERDLRSPNMTLPPLSIATSTPPTSASRSRHSLSLQLGSAGGGREHSSRPTSAGLPPIITDRERERDDVLSQRSGSARGSRNASPVPGNTPVSAKAGRMSLHNIVD